MLSSRQIILGVYYACGGKWDKMFKYLQEKTPLTPEQEEWGITQDKNKSFITILDEDYPQEFKDSYKPPFVILDDEKEKVLNSSLLEQGYPIESVIALYRSNKLKDIEKIVLEMEEKQKEIDSIIYDCLVNNNN